ncbi:MAG: DUF4160 domain-containing protein [Bdellovibrionaceae bacterium]|nr:DUF4160 domain-containing protein [Pseudobdellovibrionaceae bacterium]
MGKIRIEIKTRDHAPAHVHVVGPDAYAKIEIETLNIIESYGFSASDLNLLLKAILERQIKLMEKWNEIQGDQ